MAAITAHRKGFASFEFSRLLVPSNIGTATALGLVCCSNCPALDVLERPQNEWTLLYLDHLCEPRNVEEWPAPNYEQRCLADGTGHLMVGAHAPWYHDTAVAFTKQDNGP